MPAEMLAKGLYVVHVAALVWHKYTSPARCNRACSEVVPMMADTALRAEATALSNYSEDSDGSEICRVLFDQSRGSDKQRSGPARRGM